MLREKEHCSARSFHGLLDALVKNNVQPELIDCNSTFKCSPHWKILMVMEALVKSSVQSELLDCTSTFKCSLVERFSWSSGSIGQGQCSTRTDRLYFHIQMFLSV